MPAQRVGDERLEQPGGQIVEHAEDLPAHARRPVAGDVLGDAVDRLAAIRIGREEAADAAGPVGQVLDVHGRGVGFSGRAGTLTEPVT